MADILLQVERSRNARCDIHPGGQSRASASVPCTFSQRQGHVAIQLADGRTRQLQYKLRPGEAGWMLRLDRVVEY